MKTAFLGQAYASRSPILASQTAINIFPEVIETSNGKQVVGGFYGTPGLQSVFHGNGEVRGLWVSPTGTPGQYYLFAVIGSTVYRFDQLYHATNLGTLPNISGRVSMVDNGSQLAIAHQDGMHYVALTGAAIAPVAAAPKGAILSAIDNYGLFSENVGGEFGITALGDLSTIDALDVATAEGWPDDCVSCLADHREAWLFGTETIEIWSDTGASFFPFERVPGGFMEQGCAAKWSPAKIDNSVFWLGRDRNGRGVVYRANAYVPQRISTHAVEYAINQGVDISDAIGFAYQEEGHLFYFLTFPRLDQTWVHDVATGPQGAWHQRAYKDAQGLLHRHRANCHAYFYGDHLVGDYANGNIYRMSLNLYDDNGDEIYRERAWEVDEDENRRIRVDRVELLALAGDGQASTYGDPKVFFQKSNDSGRTWSYERFQTLGPVGARKVRAAWRRGGMGRNLVFRVGTTMRQRVSWVGANLSGEVLAV